MLPFLAKIKPQQNDIMVTRTPDEGKEPESNPGLEACAQALIDCIHSKDAKGAAAAFKDMLTMCDSPEQETE